MRSDTWARTQSLLACGVVVGPFYLAVGLIQAFVRDGFDVTRHPLSLLANGPGGWVQTANFLLSGLMVIAAAVGLGRALQPQPRAVGWVLGCFGVGMIAAAVFPADPVDGFPVGTPEGYPTTVSTSGVLHFVSAGIGFIALAVSCFVVAIAMRHRKEPAMARLSFLSGLAVVFGFFGPAVLPTSVGIAGIWFSVVVGWAWLALTSGHLYRAVRP
jgi:hypothetical membrane protein